MFYKVLALIWLVITGAASVYFVEAVHAYGTTAVTGVAFGFYLLMAAAGCTLTYLLVDKT